ncbi:MAG TPA: MAPEG family protein [Hyphomicrobium sp.]|nr:MAPEG family protein [Hyphomicrobium sp.]
MTNILYPVFALVLLTFVMVSWMAKERHAALKRREITSEPGVRPVFKGRAGQVSNAYHNLLELPLLFYAVVAFAMQTNGDDALMILLAWIYVAFRIAQALIHATYNKIVHRFSAFLGSVIVLIIMWVHLFLHVASAAV